MNRLILSSLFIYSLLVSLNCEEGKHIKKLTIEKNQTEQLIPVDFNDSNYNELNSYAIDTFTEGGWIIKYLVKDDSTRYDDIYIRWTKGNVTGTFKAESVLQFRRYFVPQYAGENKNYLFFWHGCATDCAAVLTLSKDSAFSKDYTSVIDYNIPNGQIAYLTDKSYEDDHPFQISIVDLSKNKEHLVQFKNLCMYAAHKESCIDTIIFNKGKVIVKATLRINDHNRDKKIIEEKTVNLK
jgi:hypothetical protein